MASGPSPLALASPPYGQAEVPAGLAQLLGSLTLRPLRVSPFAAMSMCFMNFQQLSLSLNLRSLSLQARLASPVSQQYIHICLITNLIRFFFFSSPHTERFPVLARCVP